MAERPVFVPCKSGNVFVEAISVNFSWHPGMAPSQKRKNVHELHSAATLYGLAKLLEVSSKSDREAGRRLSAFHQQVQTNGVQTSVECAFQGSKVFERGGPYVDLYEKSPAEAKKDPRITTSGRLVSFSFMGKAFPLSPPTVFYDWLYLNALYPHREWLERLASVDGFTDIEFNPGKSVNCQARSCALFVSLQSRRSIDQAMESFEAFERMIAVGTL
jgi:hypothetical protein